MCSVGPKDCFFCSKWIPDLTRQGFLDCGFWAVFGSYPDGVWDFSLLQCYQLVFCIVRGFRACVLLFAAFGSGVPGQISRGPKDCIYVDSKGNVKQFFGSRFWPFSARVQMVFGTFRIYSATSLCFAVRGFRKHVF